MTRQRGTWRPSFFMVLAAGILSGLGWAGSGAWADGGGTSAAPFLNIGTSSRAEAMGGAFVAVVNDVDATNYNPAGLAQLRRATIGFTHLEWFENVRYETLSYADKYDYVGAIGVSVGYLYLGDIPKTLETPTGDYDAVNSGGTFGAADLGVGLAWASSLLARENKVGVGVKLIQETIDTSQAIAVGLDLGDQYLLSKSRWYRKAAEEGWLINLVPSVAALSIRNLGTPVKYTSQNDPLPITTTLGVAYQFFEDDLTAALDVELRPADGLSVIHAGAEYWLRTGLLGPADRSLDVAFRAGYRTGYDATSAPGFSFGLGLELAGIGLDYVYMPFGDLGQTQRVSLKFSWGDVLKDKIVVKRRHVVKRSLNPDDSALQETADEMVKSKQSMEGKVVVKKTPGTHANLTEIEAKHPEGEAVASQAKSMGAQVPRGIEGAAIKVPPVISTKGLRTDSTALIAQITKGSKTSASRTQSQYTRRTTDDAARAARLEAEQKGEAFDNVEAAAQAESKETGTPGQAVTKTTVYFAAGSDSLNSKYLSALDQLAASFDRNPQRTILVHGYTSSEESDGNGLSLKRAKAVKDYLVQIKSLQASKISLKGFGDKDPAAPNDSEKNRARNRRVRVQIITAGN